MPHVNIRNEGILNLTGLDPTYPQSGLPDSEFDNTYFSCLTNENLHDNVRRGFLNLEIGDEELFLENNNLNWEATYVAEYDIHVNDRNRHYEYPNFANLNFNIPGIYSREDDFVIDNSGSALFIYDAVNTPTGIGFNFTNPNGTFAERDQPMDVCCHNYASFEKNAGMKFKKTPVRTQSSLLTVYPNPANGTRFSVKYKFKQHGKVTLEIYNLSGSRLFSKSLPVSDASKETTTVISLDRLPFSSGLHLIRINNGKEILVSKVIIIK